MVAVGNVQRQLVLVAAHLAATLASDGRGARRRLSTEAVAVGAGGDTHMRVPFDVVSSEALTTLHTLHVELFDGTRADAAVLGEQRRKAGDGPPGECRAFFRKLMHATKDDGAAIGSVGMLERSLRAAREKTSPAARTLTLADGAVERDVRTVERSYVAALVSRQPSQARGGVSLPLFFKWGFRSSHPDPTPTQVARAGLFSTAQEAAMRLHDKVTPGTESVDPACVWEHGQHKRITTPGSGDSEEEASRGGDEQTDGGGGSSAVLRSSSSAGVSSAVEAAAAGEGGDVDAALHRAWAHALGIRQWLVSQRQALAADGELDDQQRAAAWSARCNEAVAKAELAVECALESRTWSATEGGEVSALLTVWHLAVASVGGCRGECRQTEHC